MGCLSDPAAAAAGALAADPLASAAADVALRCGWCCCLLDLAPAAAAVAHQRAACQRQEGLQGLEGLGLGQQQQRQQQQRQQQQQGGQQQQQAAGLQQRVRRLRELEWHLLAIGQLQLMAFGPQQRRVPLWPRAVDLLRAGYAVTGLVCAGCGALTEADKGKPRARPAFAFATNTTAGSPEAEAVAAAAASSHLARLVLCK